jgi:uncharacterized metal-binding protein YceD (DUF177 family)
MTPEFSRPVRLGELSQHERSYEIEAGEAERAALAKRFGLESVGRLIAAVGLSSETTGRRVRLRGRFEAEVVQTCVVTLEPVPARLAGDFEVLYDRTASPAGREVVVDAGDPDMVPLEGDTIDIGEAVAEELSLSLDPYPRAPGAQIEGAAPADEAGHRPFEVLARLKGKH